MISKYLELIKPRIIIGNIISLIGGFLFASKSNVKYILLFTLLISMSLIMSSGCVFNNIIDRDIDAKMRRTKNRVLANGLVSIKKCIIYGLTLGLSGFLLLYISCNILVLSLAIIAFVVYVIIYSLYMKRHSIYGTLIGSFAGASPPVIGYCAVANNFDTCALIFFTMFVLWQISHSYAIAILNYNDYKKINLPVLPIVRNISIAKKHIMFCISMFVIMSIMLTFLGYTGYYYLIVTTITGLVWFIIGLSSYKSLNKYIWARKLFIFSIVVISIFSLMIGLDYQS